MSQMYIPGMGLGYKEWSGAPDGTSPVVLFLHDLGQNGLIWRTLAQSLSESGFHSYALDLPAHGESGPCPWGYSLTALRSVLEGFRAGMGLACPHWVATGFATKILLDYAAHVPDQVRSMVLIEPVEPEAVPAWRRLPAYWAMRRWMLTAGPFARAEEMMEAGRHCRPYRRAWDAPASGWPDPQNHPISHAFFAGMQQGADGAWHSRLPRGVYQRYVEAQLASDVLTMLPQVTAPALIVGRKGRANSVRAALAAALSLVEEVSIGPDEDPLVRPGPFSLSLQRWLAVPAPAALP